MPTAPTLAQVKDSLGSENVWTDPAITEALEAEIEAQATRVRFPADPLEGDPLPYPADLAAALTRRVQQHLVLKGLPTGLNVSTSDDPEVRRLEAPHRRRPLG